MISAISLSIKDNCSSLPKFSADSEGPVQICLESYLDRPSPGSPSYTATTESCPSLPSLVQLSLAEWTWGGEVVAVVFCSIHFCFRKGGAISRCWCWVPILRLFAQLQQQGWVSMWSGIHCWHLAPLPGLATEQDATTTNAKKWVSEAGASCCIASCCDGARWREHWRWAGRGVGLRAWLLWVQS